MVPLFWVQLYSWRERAYLAGTAIKPTRHYVHTARPPKTNITTDPLGRPIRAIRSITRRQALDDKQPVEQRQEAHRAALDNRRDLALNERQHSIVSTRASALLHLTRSPSVTNNTQPESVMNNTQPDLKPQKK